ncbi:Hsp70 family protein [Actinoalloteichus spitiensis]|uniref:Hsp70 family protein n=1 Tax=Actinoalloteichus spitiensis TaxID=252394 RepID=UPI0003772077|nr:Hsp70 family protein [Actinoalloteichus spitiensis]
MRELAVDFGTSNTVAAVRTSPHERPRLLAVDGWQALPSAVWLAPDGELVVGIDAQRQARLDPSRYEPTPKLRVDEAEVLLGDRVVPVVDLIAAVLRRVAGEARRQLGGEPDRVVLTHPADWHRVRRNTLRAAARAAGWSAPVSLLAEPVAAAAHFVEVTSHDQVVRPGQALAVFDMGGGTTDTALVHRGPDHGWRVRAEAGTPDFGGGDVDQLVLEHIRASVGADRPEWGELLRPSGPAARRAARALADDVRAGKEALSRYPQTDVPLPDPLPDAHVTRAELEALVRPRLERTVAMLAGTVGAARADLAGVFLVGGATRMPLVATMIGERLGVVPVAVESPESSVALGALTTRAASDFTGPGRPPGEERPPDDGEAVTEVTRGAGEEPTRRLADGPAAGPPGAAAGTTVPTDADAPTRSIRPEDAPTHRVAATPAGVPTGYPATRPVDASRVYRLDQAPWGPVPPGQPGRGGGSRRVWFVVALVVVVVAVAVAAVLRWFVPAGDASRQDLVGDGGRGGTSRIAETWSSGAEPPSEPDPGEEVDPSVGALFLEAGLQDFAASAAAGAEECGPADMPVFEMVVGSGAAVTCEYTVDGVGYTVTFLSGRGACEVALLATAFGESQGSGTWSGGGYSGRYRFASLPAGAPASAALTYTAEGEPLCGAVEPSGGTRVTPEQLVAFWEDNVRPVG